MSLASSSTILPASKVSARPVPGNGVTRALGLLVRMVLVMLLIADQLGAPLHAHHHDFGVDGLSMASVHDGNIAEFPHIEDHAETRNGHSVLALRVDGRTVVASHQKADDSKPPAFDALLIEAVTPQLEIRREPHDWPRKSARLYFTGVIRPQVRAPPLHA